ncbi:MAG: response regulator [Nitrospinota bacterium]|nr:response regulator [Nitrospinota bacterium]
MAASLSSTSSDQFTPFIIPNELQTVLVVEDCQNTRSLIYKMLRSRVGCNVITADGGAQALGVVGRQRVDLALLDLLMPGIDGYTLLKSIKSDDKLKDIQVIVLTGVDNVEKATECLKAGADDYLVKPYDFTLLQAKIVSFLEKKRLIDTQKDFATRLAAANAELVNKMAQLEKEMAERKAAVEARHEGDTRFRILAEAAFEGVVIHKNGYVISSNARFTRMFQIDPRQVTGVRIFDLVAEENHDNLRKQLTQDDSWLMEVVCVCPQGDRLEVELHGRCIPHDGQWASVLSFRDITQRKQAERSLAKAAEEAKRAMVIRDNFISLLSHNLREPVATVVSMLNALGAMEDGSDLRANLMARCVKNANSLNSMIERLLDLGRLRRGKIELFMAPANGRAMVDETLERMSASASIKNIRMENRIPPGWMFNTDSGLLIEALHNLVSNAVKFSHCGGQVVVSLVRHEGNPAIAVRDYGIGVDQVSRDFLFLGDQKYRRKSPSGERGLGIGLALSAEIISVLGGRISVECPEDGGSIFYLYLPASSSTMLLVTSNQSEGLALQKVMGPANAGISMACGHKEAHGLAAVFKPQIVVACADCGNPAWLAELAAISSQFQERKPAIVALLDSPLDGGSVQDGISVILKSEVEKDLNPALRRILGKSS